MILQTQNIVSAAADEVIDVSKNINNTTTGSSHGKIVKAIRKGCAAQDPQVPQLKARINELENEMKETQMEMVRFMASFKAANDCPRGNLTTTCANAYKSVSENSTSSCANAYKHCPGGFSTPYCASEEYNSGMSDNDYPRRNLTTSCANAYNHCPGKNLTSSRASAYKHCPGENSTSSRTSYYNLVETRHHLVPMADIVSNRDIYSAGFRLLAKVNEIINDDAWSWPNDWLLKYPRLVNLDVPNLSNADDGLVWRDRNNVDSRFSVATAWECIRPRANEVDW
ncbi:hypothetical protein Tco_1000424, partial [Tanacetum coccineum]